MTAPRSKERRSASFDSVQDMADALGKIQTLLAATIFLPSFARRLIIKAFNNEVAAAAEADNLTSAAALRRLRRDMINNRITKDSHLLAVSNLWMAMILWVSFVGTFAAGSVGFFPLLIGISILLPVSFALKEFWETALTSVSDWQSGLPVDAIRRKLLGLPKPTYHWAPIQMSTFVPLAAAVAFIIANISLVAVEGQPIFAIFAALSAEAVRRHQRATIIALYDGTDATDTAPAYNFNFGNNT